MHILFRRAWLYIAFAIFISIIFSFLKYGGISLVWAIDSLFLTSLLFIVIGAFMLTSRGGFFDAITISFRKVLNRLSKRRQQLQNDLDTMSLPSELFSQTATMAFIITGISLLIISTVISIFII